MRRSFVLVSVLQLLVSVWYASMPALAHDLERTRVTLAFSRDGSFVLDVSNDPQWLKLRLQRFVGPFTDRVVLFVDGHEVLPTSIEYRQTPEIGTYRMRGRVPLDAHTLRWYYGLVVDPYPLMIRRADGRVQIEEIPGDAWSRPVDLSGQFEPRRLPDWLAQTAAFGALLLALSAMTLPFARQRIPGLLRRADGRHKLL